MNFGVGGQKAYSDGYTDKEVYTINQLCVLVTYFLEALCIFQYLDNKGHGSLIFFLKT